MEDFWKIGNRLRITTIYDYTYYDEYNGNDVNEGKKSYEGIVVERNKGLSLKIDDDKYFDCQCVYWFGSILKQNIEKIN